MTISTRKVTMVRPFTRFQLLFIASKKNCFSLTMIGNAAIQRVQTNAGIRRKGRDITSPMKITSVNPAKGLLNNVAMTEAGSTGTYRYYSSTQIPAGEPHNVIVSGVYNNQTLVYAWILSRDL